MLKSLLTTVSAAIGALADSLPFIGMVDAFMNGETHEGVTIFRHRRPVDSPSLSTRHSRLMDEAEIIAIINQSLGTPEGTVVGIGDDAAVMERGSRVICHDMLVDTVHFRWEWTTPAALGHKALAVNLSDVAAMGARPHAAVVALALAPNVLGRDGIAELFDGLRKLGALHQVAIVGGDLSRSPVTMIGVTVTGDIPAGMNPVTRAGGRPGDVLYVTGALGCAAAGLAVLTEPGRLARFDADGHLARALLCPVPRVAEGIALGRSGVNAMMDCSDGLAIDCGRLAAASGVRAVIDLEKVPCCDAVERVAAALHRDPEVFAATGGEDYELVVAAPAENDLPPGVDLIEIGYLDEGEGIELRRGNAVVNVDALGWDHHPGNS